MKYLIGIVFCCLMVVSFQPMEDVPVQHTMGCGERLWNAVETAMIQTNDPRSVDEVVFETRKLNNIDNAKLAQLGFGNTIIIPCKRNKWF